MLPALGNLASTVAIAAAALAAAAISAPVARTIGLWAGGYVVLSLSLALGWMLLVSIGRIYQRRRSADQKGLEPALNWYPLPRFIQHEDATSMERSQREACFVRLANTKARHVRPR